MAKEKIKLNPTDRDIIRTLIPLKLPVTPSKIAKAINAHPATVQRRLENLDKLRITECVKAGKNKQMKCKIRSGWKGIVKDSRM